MWIEGANAVNKLVSLKFCMTFLNCSWGVEAVERGENLGLKDNYGRNAYYWGEFC
jgi:hypothetical protein